MYIYFISFANLEFLEEDGCQTQPVKNVNLANTTWDILILKESSWIICHSSLPGRPVAAGKRSQEQGRLNSLGVVNTPGSVLDTRRVVTEY